MILMFAALAAAPAAAGDPVIARMAALYDEVCLVAFPSDDRVDAAMAARGAKPLTAEQVKVTLRDDPGRGWLLDDPDGHAIQIMLELPPYHACSVRHMTRNGLSDPASYKAAADRFKRTRPGFTAATPMDQVRDGLHIQATIEQRPLASGGAEALMVFEQRVVDPNRVAAGDTLVNLRFVHQIVATR